MRVKTVLAAALVAAIITGPALAGLKPITIMNDGGGQLWRYHRSVVVTERAGNPVKFVGSCASACTLFLTIPNKRLCIYPTARFGFHQAHGSTPSANAMASKKLLDSYPVWVRHWINSRGGLVPGDRIDWMPYEYAARFLRTCF
jgi:hypothetical protein